MKPKLIQWIAEQRKQGRLSRWYHNELTRRIVSLVLVFDLIIVSCFCYSLNTGESRADSVSASYAWFPGTTTADSRYDSYGAVTPGSDADHPYLIETVGELYGLARWMAERDLDKYPGIQTMAVTLELDPESATDGALDAEGNGNPSESTSGGAAAVPGTGEEGNKTDGASGAEDQTQPGGQESESNQGGQSGQESGADKTDSTGKTDNSSKTDSTDKSGGTDKTDGTSTSGQNGSGSSNQSDSKVDPADKDGSSSGASGTSKDTGAKKSEAAAVSTVETSAILKGLTGSLTTDIPLNSTFGSASGTDKTDKTNKTDKPAADTGAGSTGGTSDADGTAGGSTGGSGSGDSSADGSQSGSGTDSGSDNNSGSNTNDGANTGGGSGSEPSTGGSGSTDSKDDLTPVVPPASDEENKKDEVTPPAEDSGNDSTSSGSAVDKPADDETDGTVDGEDGQTTPPAVDEAPLDELEAIQTLEAKVKYITPDRIKNGFRGEYFVLSSSIDLADFNGDYISSVVDGSGWDATWVPIGSAYEFNANFRAEDSVVISNFPYANDTNEKDKEVNKAYDFYGLFGMLGSSAVIDGLTFTDVNFQVTDNRMNQANSSMGVVAASNKGIIKNVKVMAPDKDGHAGIELREVPYSGLTPSRFGGIVALNSGFILNSAFYGTIHSDGELFILKSDTEYGIGGIAGISKAMSGSVASAPIISNCVANAKITFKDSGTVNDIMEAQTGISEYFRVGGIAAIQKGSSQDQAVIQNCVFNGQISAKARYDYNQIGGIAGYTENTAIQECIASADIQWASPDSNASSCGVGGILGAGAGTSTVNTSFALGLISATGTGGGLVGQGAAVTNSYYNGSVMSPALNTRMMVGGISGTSDSKSAVSNSYFSGTVLTPQTGSLFGQINRNYTVNDRVFYDAEVALNGPAALLSGNGRSISGVNKTTAELCSETDSGLQNVVSGGASSEGDIWSAAADHYPRLVWADSVAAGATVSFGAITESEISVTQDFVKLVKNYSKLSTMKRDASSSELVNGLEGTDIRAEGTAENIEGLYSVYPGNVVGTMSQPKISFTLDDAAFTAQIRTKKLIEPKEGALTAEKNVITNTTEFYKFLDYWQAGGAVLDSEFYISAAAIDADQPIKPMTDYKRGVFAGSLDGRNSVIENITFEDGTRGLLGDGFGGDIQNLVFRNITAGTETITLVPDTTSFGTLFGTAHSVKSIKNIKLENLKLFVNRPKSQIYGGVIGDVKNSQSASSVIENVSIDGFDGKVGDYSTSKVTGENKIDSFGGIAGKLIKTNAANLSINSMNVTLDLDEPSASGKGIGGIIGYAGNSIQITGCSLKGSFQTSVRSGISWGIHTGGIAGRLEASVAVSDCSVVGSISGKTAGGVIGYFERSSTLANSYFAGTLTGASGKEMLGGLASTAVGGNTIINSFAFGTIYGSELSSNADRAGGLIGSASGTITIDKSYSNCLIDMKGDAGGFIGGGNETAVITSSYFVGQLKNAVNRGALLGPSEATLSSANQSAFYDVNLMGRVSNVYKKVNDYTAGLESDSITAVALAGGEAFGEATQENYPQLSVFAGTAASEEAKKVSDLSTRKVFTNMTPGSTLMKVIFAEFDTVNYSTNGGIALTVTPAAAYADRFFKGTPAEAAAAGSNAIIAYQDSHYASTGNEGIAEIEVMYKLGDTMQIPFYYKLDASPFEYGEGTESDPYIIYNEDVFYDFASYVTNKRDTAEKYYKIASVDEGSVGASIQLDLEKTPSPLKPILNFVGHLDGNGSDLKMPLNMGSISVTEGTATSRYRGLFGTIMGSTAEIHDLTLTDVHLTATGTEIVGGLAAYAKGGTFTNIAVRTTSAGITTNYNGSIGGLIGSVSTDIAVLDSVVFDGKLRGGTNTGGLIGLITGSVTARKSAAYGSISGAQNTGGLIGALNREASKVTELKYCISGIDMIGGSSGDSVGGLIGANSLNAYNLTKNGGMSLKINESTAFGKIEKGSASYVGGLIGRTDITVKSGYHNDTTMSGPIDSSYIQETEGTVDEQIEQILVSQFIDNAYPYELNPYHAINAEPWVHYTYYDSNFDGFVRYSDPVRDIFAGKSYSWSLASGGRPDDMSAGSWSDSNWNYEKGMFPIIKYTGIASPQAVKLANEIKFSSIALFMTRAGKAGENKYQSVYIIYDGGTSPAAIAAPGLKFTDNGLMGVATGENKAAEVTLTWNGFEKKRSFTASTEASGAADMSWYVVNPQGMWDYDPLSTAVSEIDSEGIETTATTKLIKKGWTVYTADQLQGLALLTQVTGNPAGKSSIQTFAEDLVENGDGTGLISLLAEKIAGGVRDDNGVTLADQSFYIPADSENTSGSTTEQIHYRIMLGQNVEMGVYKPFTPIGTADQPFIYGFDGMGYSLSGLRLTAADAAVGLFGTASGATIENTGVFSGDWKLESGTEPVGTIAGRILNGTLLRSCFASAGMFGDGIGVRAGGLVGESDGSAAKNTIENSFFTGALQLTGDNTAAGGLVALASDTVFRQNFTAGYVQAVTDGAIAGIAGTGNQSILNVYDRSATGKVQTGAGKVEAEAKTTAEMMSYDRWNSEWVSAAGYYPVPEIFTEDTTSGSAVVKTVKSDMREAAIPVEALPQARSASQGRILYSGADLLLTPQAITWNVTTGTAISTRDALGYPLYLMEKSGMIWLKMRSTGQTRDVLFNLRCWYEEPEIGSGGTKTYTISAASELAELAAIVEGTVNVSNPNGTHTHGGGAEDYFDLFENCKIVLSDDIDLSVLSGWKSIGTEAHPFMGTFDGQEHVIFNINQQAGGSLGGLFGVVKNAVIQNTGLQSGTIQSDIAAGGLAAQLSGTSSIRNCFTSVNVSSKNEAAGGLAGYVGADASVSNSFSMSRVDGTQAGGIAGGNYGRIESSYNTGIVSAGIAAGGIAGINTGSVSGGFSAGAVLNSAGGSLYGVAPGTVSGSWFDKQMTGTVTAVSGAEGRLTIEKAPNGYYEDSAVKEGTSDLFRSARGISVLALDFDGGSYSKFTAGTANKKLAPSAGGADVLMRLTGDIFRCIPSEDKYQVTVDDASSGGGDVLTASVHADEEGVLSITKPYYLYTKPMISVRYHFIFTEEFINAVSGSAVSAGTADYTIDSAAALKSLIASINSGANTEGKTYRLTTDLAGVGLISPIGTEANPFNGTFDGNGHTIEGASVNSSGLAGFFGAIGSYGKVKNLELKNFSVTAAAPDSGNLYTGMIAAKNEGAVVNVSVTGQLVASNSDMAGTSYLGGLIGENKGRVEGASLYSSGSYIIEHGSKESDMAGGFAGVNQGSFNGCYLSGNILNPAINAMFGSTLNGTFRNCFYNFGSTNNSVDELKLQYAYDDVEVKSEEGRRYFVPYSQISRDSFAEILSSDLYGGTWIQKGEGHPSLAAGDIMGMELGELELMLSVRNLVAKPGEANYDSELTDSFMNGISTYWNYGFPYFSNFSFNRELQVEMPLLERTADYSVDARIYGKNATWEDVEKLNNGQLANNAADISNMERTGGVYKMGIGSMTNVNKPKSIMLNITLKPSADPDWPWGVYRTETNK